MAEVLEGVVALDEHVQLGSFPSLDILLNLVSGIVYSLLTSCGHSHTVKCMASFNILRRIANLRCTGSTLPFDLFLGESYQPFRYLVVWHTALLQLW